LENSEQYSGNVYGSRFAAQHMPQHEMPEGEMPSLVAARMIKDGESCGQLLSPLF
jgi:glutamate decarboxylase